MSRYKEDKKRYMIARKMEDGNESLASIDNYTSNIYWTDSIESASKFESLDEAKEFIKAYDSLTKLLKKECEYQVLEEHRVISEVLDKKA